MPYNTKPRTSLVGEPGLNSNLYTWAKGGYMAASVDACALSVTPRQGQPGQ